MCNCFLSSVADRSDKPAACRRIHCEEIVSRASVELLARAVVHQVSIARNVANTMAPCSLCACLFSMCMRPSFSEAAPLFPRFAKDAIAAVAAERMKRTLCCCYVVRIYIYLLIVSHKGWHHIICIFTNSWQPTARNSKVRQFSKIARTSRSGAEGAGHFNEHLIICDLWRVRYYTWEEHLVLPLPNDMIVAFE